MSCVSLVCLLITSTLALCPLHFRPFPQDIHLTLGYRLVDRELAYTKTSVNSKKKLGNLINDSSGSIEASRSQEYGSEATGEENGYDIAKEQQPRLGANSLRRAGHVGVGGSLSLLGPLERTGGPQGDTASAAAVGISVGSDHEGGGTGDANQDEWSRSPSTSAGKWQQRTGGKSLVQNGVVIGVNNRFEKTTGLSNNFGGEIYLGIEVPPLETERSWVDNRNLIKSGVGGGLYSADNLIYKGFNSSNDISSQSGGGKSSNRAQHGKTSLLSKRKKYSPRRIAIHPAGGSPGSSSGNNTSKHSLNTPGGGGSPRYLRGQIGDGSGSGVQSDSPSSNSVNRNDSSVVHCKIQCEDTTLEGTGANPPNIIVSDSTNNEDSSEYPAIKVERNIEGHFVIKETTNHYYSTGNGNNTYSENPHSSTLENGCYKRRNSRSNKSLNHPQQNQSLSWVEIQQQRHLNEQQNRQHKHRAHHRPNSGLKIHHIVKNGREIYPPGLDSRSATPCYIRDQQSPIWVTRASRTEALADDEENPQDSEWAERVSLSDASDYQYPESGRQSPRTGPEPVRAGHGKPTKANNRPRRTGMSRRGRRGCCKVLRLKEDNARFFLLAIVMVFYMLTGAAIFSAIERDNELDEKEVYRKHIEQFKTKYPFVNETDLNLLLRIHSEAETAGYVGDKRPRWDFSGSFYFVGTVVSTIGFGMTTPRTPAGKVILVFYGFFGCAGAILFFNLFLERIITFLAYILRAIHDRGQRKQGLAGRRRSSQGSDDEQLDSWKPSVYWVMLILLLGAISVALVASGMYHPVEDWTFWDAMYFCFVTFATIGFGDYVVSQKDDYPNVVLYRLGNFVFIVLGCCCVYSLFNVTSIVIKQLLNWMLRKLNCECRLRRPQVTRRNAITPGHLQRGKAKAAGALNRGAAATAASTSGDPVNKAPMVTVTDADGDSDSEYRRNSGEMISMKDFLQANKISLAMMQKQLWETSQRSFNHNNNSGFQGGVGPLAILNRKLGQDEFDPSM